MVRGCRVPVEKRSSRVTVSQILLRATTRAKRAKFYFMRKFPNDPNAKLNCRIVSVLVSTAMASMNRGDMGLQQTIAHRFLDQDKFRPTGGNVIACNE